MKFNYSDSQKSQTGEIVATFGEAKLIKGRDGRYQLRGGRPDDCFEAREWASLFLHEAVFAMGDSVAKRDAKVAA